MKQMKIIPALIFCAFSTEYVLAQNASAMNSTNSTNAAATQVAQGTLVSVSGNAEIKVANDQATLNFFIEEQDKDKALAASRVNQKMKSGTELAKKEDPSAQLTTRGYYSYPIYADELNNKPGAASKRQLIGWRVGQYLEVKTTNLKNLTSLAAALQKTLALSGVSFDLTDQARKNLEEKRIEAGYKNFQDRVRMISKAMGRKESDVIIESLEFDPSENISTMQDSGRMYAMKAAPAAEAVAETSFEPGETAVTIRVFGKVRVK
jgi:predicted secreted protein